MNFYEISDSIKSALVALKDLGVEHHMSINIDVSIEEIRIDLNSYCPSATVAGRLHSRCEDGGRLIDNEWYLTSVRAGPDQMCDLSINRIGRV